MEEALSIEVAEHIFFWGAGQWNNYIFIFALVIAVVINGTVFVIDSDAGQYNPSTAGDIENYRVLIGVSVAYIMVTFGQNFSAMFIDKTNADLAHITTRGFHNGWESRLPFLLLLWLHGIFINNYIASRLGWIYVITRFFYPFAYGFYGQFTVLVEPITQTNWSVIAYLAVSLIFTSAGIDLAAEVKKSSPALMYLVMFACLLCFHIATTIQGLLISTCMTRGVQWKNETDKIQ